MAPFAPQYPRSHELARDLRAQATRSPQGVLGANLDRDADGLHRLGSGRHAR